MTSQPTLPYALLLYFYKIPMRIGVKIKKVHFYPEPFCTEFTCIKVFHYHKQRTKHQLSSQLYYMNCLYLFHKIVMFIVYIKMGFD